METAQRRTGQPVVIAVTPTHLKREEKSSGEARSSNWQYVGRLRAPGHCDSLGVPKALKIRASCSMSVSPASHHIASQHMTPHHSRYTGGSRVLHKRHREGVGSNLTAEQSRAELGRRGGEHLPRSSGVRRNSSMKMSPAAHMSTPPE